MMLGLLFLVLCPYTGGSEAVVPVHESLPAASRKEVAALQSTLSVASPDPVQDEPVSAVDVVAEEFPLSRFRPKELPPVAHDGPVLVSFSIAVLQLLGVDAQTQSFEVIAKLHYSWMDPRLDPGPVGVVNLDPSTIWIPKVQAVNLAEEVTLSESVRLVKQSERVSKIHVTRRIRGRYFINLNFRWFPFDRHDLPISFQIVGHHEEHVRWVLSPQTSLSGAVARDYTGTWAAMISTYSNDPIWIAEAINATNENPSTTGFPTTVVEIFVRRSIMNHIWTMILPMCVLTLCSYASFWVDPSNGSTRVTLVTILLLSSFLVMQSMQQEFPKVGYPIWQELFNLFNVLFLFIALLFFVIVHHNKRIEDANAALSDSQPLLGAKKVQIQSENIDMKMKTTFLVFYVLGFLIFFIPALIYNGSSPQLQVLTSEPAFAVHS